MRRRFVTVVLLVVVVAAPACRSRVKKSAAPVTVPEATAVQIVQEPTNDFVSVDAETARDRFSDAELNRIARDRGWVQDAFFAYDTNTLDAEAQAALNTSARWLRENSGVRVVIEGHCDERGTEQYNLALGERRANTARLYLSALGVDPARMSQVSYGEENPFAEGSHPEAWRQNRRAHLRIEQGR